MRRIILLALAGVCTTSMPALAQGVGGKTACGLLSPAELKKITGRADVARSPGQPEEAPGSSNCLFMGAIDISIHLGEQTKLMFGRERDNYAKAPARLGYKVERLSGLGDDAYYLTTSGQVQVRALVGAGEVAVSLSGSLPQEPAAKTLALSLAKAAVAKLLGQ